MAARDPGVLEELGACPVCLSWDASKIERPIDVPLLPTNKKKGTVDPSFYKNLWTSISYSSPITILHRRFFDTISDGIDDQILIGDVYVLGGDRIADLVSVCDREHTPLRVKYGKTVFKHPLLKQWVPCQACGRFPEYTHFGKRYIYSKELPNRGVRILGGSVLMSPQEYRRGGFMSQAMWPKLKVEKIPEFDSLLDPVPSPYPQWWSEIEDAFSSVDVVLPFPMINLKKDEGPGSWIVQRSKELGHDLYLRYTQEPSDGQVLAVMIFYLRLRALFEPNVAKRIDRWSDDELRRFMMEYYEVGRTIGHDYSLVSYFPV